MNNNSTACIHTHWQVAQSSHTRQNLPKSMAAPTHGRRKSTGIQHCIRAIAGEVVNSRSVHLINFGSGGQVIALKSATALILERCEQFKPTLPILTENRMLKNVELNSKRLKTRNLNEGDIEKLFKIYSDKESMKFRGSKPMNKIADASKMIFDQTIEENNIIKIRKAIIKKENKELIGTLLLECDKSFPNRCEIGFSFEKSEWNNGYGKETLDMVLEKLKTINSIKEVKAWCIKKNIASVKILEKKGFTRINQNEFPESYLFIKELKKTAHNN